MKCQHNCSKRKVVYCKYLCYYILENGDDDNGKNQIYY